MEENTSWFSWALDVIYSALLKVGLASYNAKLLFLGLDNAGKTTLLKKISKNVLSSLRPTIHPNHEELVLGSIVFQIYDLGGHSTARMLWDDYLVGVDGIVYMVDATDEDERIFESNKELKRLMQLEGYDSIPIVVLGNKIDMPSAMSESAFRMKMGLQCVDTTGKNTSKAEGRPIEVFMTSVVQGSGYTEAFQWISKFIL